MPTFTGNNCDNGTWQRPVPNYPLPSEYLSEIATAVGYVVHQVTLECEGDVTFTLEGSIDHALFLYAVEPDPEDQLAGMVVGRGAWSYDPPEAGFTVFLAAGTYWLVVTGYEDATCEDYSLGVVDDCGEGCVSIFGAECNCPDLGARPAAAAGPAMPGLGRQAMNASGAALAVACAAAKRLARGRNPGVFAPAEVAAKRLAICQACGWHRAGKCRHCGCRLGGANVFGKVRLAAMKCPLKVPKWGAWTGV